MKNRTWHYVENPTTFDLRCSKNENHKITWSEYENHIWCFDCEKDIKYKPGASIFPIHLAETLGIVFDKIDLERNLYLKYNSKDDTYTEIVKE